VINEQTGELLRDLILDSTRDYQPQDPSTKRDRPNVLLAAFEDGEMPAVERTLHDGSLRSNLCH
jgi:hypothetical protein